MIMDIGWNSLETVLFEVNVDKKYWCSNEQSDESEKEKFSPSLVGL